MAIKAIKKGSTSYAFKRNFLSLDQMKRFIITFFVMSACFLCFHVYAQKDGEPIPFGSYRKIYSKILNEERTLLVYLPRNYDQTQKHYPVLYQLDGWNQQYLRGIAAVERLIGENSIPEVIYIAIANKDRDRDMLPYKTAFHRTAGGADNFIRFLADELVPFVNKYYRTTSYSALIGFSNSAQFVLYTLLTKPESFDAYIPCSPSIAWDVDYYKKKLLSLFNKNKTLNKTLSIVYGGGEGKSYYGDQYYYDMLCVNDLIDIMKNNSPEGFEWRVNVIEGGRHVPYGCIYEGLKAVFQGWQPIEHPEIIPSGGFFDQSITVIMKANRGEVHYTTDGSEPTRESAKYTKEIIIDEPTILKAKIYQENYGESRTISSHFNRTPMFEPVKDLTGLESGLRYFYYENYEWYQLPDFNSIKPVETGNASSINLSYKKRYEGFALQFEGFINIDKSGTYRFYLTSNDESRLLIDNKIIIHRERSYELEEKSGQVTLEKGKHPFAVLYVGLPFRRKLNLSVYYEGPGVKKQKIPAEVLYHKSY